MHMYDILTNTEKRNGCRKRLSLNNSELLYLDLSTLIQSTLILFTTGLLPALFSCCSPIDEPHSAVMFNAERPMNGTEVRTLDIFTFNDDELRRLDSYQRIEYPDSDEIGIRSQNGDKHIILCANAHISKEDWAGVNSVESLEGRYADLMAERRECLLMTGRSDLRTGIGTGNAIVMRPLIAEVVLKSIRCDFTGKTYEGKEVTDVCVYLTNVNARCQMLAEGKIKPTHIINTGGPDMDAIMSMAEPDMLFKELKEPVGNTVCQTDIRLLCYPNSWPEESPGTPFTRLVIEGSLDGDRYIWPIEVNRAEGETDAGIHRNCSYVHDVVLTRKGLLSHDDKFETDMMTINMDVVKWKEKERYSIPY